MARKEKVEINTKECHTMIHNNLGHLNLTNLNLSLYRQTNNPKYLTEARKSIDHSHKSLSDFGKRISDLSKIE